MLKLLFLITGLLFWILLLILGIPVWIYKRNLAQKNKTLEANKLWSETSKKIFKDLNFEKQLIELAKIMTKSNGLSITLEELQGAMVTLTGRTKGNELYNIRKSLRKVYQTDRATQEMTLEQLLESVGLDRPE